MQIKRNLERFIHYLLLAGFLLLGAGVVISILRSGMPIELTLILVGIAMIILGILIAKIFGEVLDGRHKMG